MGSFACGLSLQPFCHNLSSVIFAFEASVMFRSRLFDCDLLLGFTAWNLRCGSFRWGPFALGLLFDIFRLGSSFGSFVCDMRLGVPGL